MVLHRAPVDSQVNNAGTGYPKPVTLCTADDFKYIMTTNVEAAFHVCQLAHPLLKASGRGSIVFNSSISGSIALEYLSIYGITKGFTEKNKTSTEMK